MQQHHNEHFPVELSSQLVSIITTEHYNLQTGRSMAIAETNGRSSLFVGAVSSGLIALTFVGQISHLGMAFFVFSLVVIPTLVFMGLITFVRVLQSGSADITLARGVNRIRHLYLEHAPQLQPYFMLSAHDDRGETLSHEEMSTSWVQVFFNTAGMIAVINSVLIGSIVGLYKCGSRDIPGECGSSSTVSMESMDAPGTKSPHPLSKPSRRVEDERRGPLVSVLILHAQVANLRMLKTHMLFLL